MALRKPPRRLSAKARRNMGKGMQAHAKVQKKRGPVPKAKKRTVRR